METVAYKMTDWQTDSLTVNLRDTQIVTYKYIHSQRQWMNEWIQSNSSINEVTI